MKILITTLSLFLAFHSFAQENAFDYMVPNTTSERYFYQSESNYIKGDLATMPTKYSSVKRSVRSNYKSDGSIGYKFIYYSEDLFSSYENYAYFLNFNGSSANLYGHSKYLNEEDYLMTYVYDESYTEINPFTFIKVPSESYQTTDWTYKNPETGQEVSATASYKTITIGGYERKVLLVERKENGVYKKEYYLKHFGLVAFDYNYNLYIADLKKFNLYTKSFIDSKTETELRVFGWEIIGRMRKISTSDSFMRYGNKERKEVLNKLDSLEGLYQHMIFKSPDMLNVYRYIMSVYVNSALDKMNYPIQKTKAYNYHYSEVIDWFEFYYLLRPHPETITKTNLSTYVTGVNDNFYTTYWENELRYINFTYSNSEFDKKYIMFLLKPRAECILKYVSTMSDKDKCLLYSCVALYYSLASDIPNQYKYLVSTMEYYKSLTAEDKDINIDYMRSVMTNLATLKPGSEEDLNRAIIGAINLKDYNNAVKIAANGYKQSVGMSMTFAFNYAEAAYGDEINKDNLRNAMNMLKNKVEEMTSSQLSNYIKYCRAMSPEYDCSKAESLYEKKTKKEEKVQKTKSKSNKSSSYSSSRNVNLAIMANPFAGLNLSGKGGYFKFLPLSATLRTKSVLHEVRYNPFLGFDTKGRFVAGKMTDSKVTTNDGWKNLKGYDISYAIIFGKNDYSSYSKTVTSTGGGLTFLYGDFTTDNEVVTATINNIPTNIILRPQIKRYETFFTFNMTALSWKTHLAMTMYYGIGAGLRTLTYGNQTFSQETLSNPDVTSFSDKRWVQSNWTGPYFTARAGFRFGITLF